MQYLEIDNELSQAVTLSFADSNGDRGGQITNKIRTYRVPFQFPPRVTSDSKSGDWNETSSNSVLSEPVATFNGSKPRTINIKWSYIVDDIDSAGWTTKKIATITQALRGYFTRMDNNYLAGNFNYKPTLVYFQMYRNQYNSRTFRLESADISFSENLIVPSKKDLSNQPFVVDEYEQYETESGTFKQAFPLRTDISITLKPYIRAIFTLGQTAPTPPASTGGGGFLGGIFGGGTAQPSTPPAPLEENIGTTNRGWF